MFLTASIGIAFCPRDAENVIDLIRNADAAMYYSKQNGGNTFAFYSPEMNAAAVERLMLKSKLRRALERDELVIRYQPKVDLRNGRIIGAEALLRWRLPGHGDIPPSQFIPLAEETNLILDIGEWVLNRVCMDYRQMQSEGGDPGRVSLNLSLKQLRQASFILRCRSVFRRHGVSPTAFELEITETTLMADQSAPCDCSMSSTRWGCICRSTTSAPAIPRSRRCSSSRSARSRSISPSCAMRVRTQAMPPSCAPSSRWAAASAWK